ncbi:sucrose-6-phosphate hydrolase-like [Cydia pomonella]|uniref:sucrose-6-phosphate hydrolase-like n=1 Tax=Cydia pomonella TaxID=82600 RepID=UPI002ADDA453|nr:sucrose-6-phosphate hydrolase-like [Cydia pomonella]
MVGVLKVILLLFVSYTSGKVLDRYYPRYHLAPPYGWMNDPNGFCVFNNEVHMFYQHNPDSSVKPGYAQWGHATSKDFFHWKHQPIAMRTDMPYDSCGAFSGSSLIENNIMYVFYTGNVIYPGKTPDHQNRQALAFSTDGINFIKYASNPIITGYMNTPDIRDPKVWKHDGTYYMVLGSSVNNQTHGGIGNILLYSSPDKFTWNYVSVLAQANGTFGFMWECPDLFELDGKYVLLFSPQGVKASGDRYQNVYQTGYFIGDFDYSTLKFTPTSEFVELDNGHDFYATQTTLDNFGRRIVVGWMDMWYRDYPEGPDGFTGILTMPRELRLLNGKIVQLPLAELSSIRGRQVLPINGYYILCDKAGEVDVFADGLLNFQLYIESENVKVTLSYDAVNGKVTLDRGGKDSIRRTEWRPASGQLKWRVFVDASSIELFCGEGEVTFSSRFFPEGAVVIYQRGTAVLTVHEILRSMPRPT